ncbi:MAG: histidine phosphatase family protein [Vicinamibacterales bacterium]
MPDIPLFFETHATSLDNEAGLASGWYDVDLSPRGETQAHELGERYRHRELAVVFCSDLRRAYRTAEIAFARRAVPIVRDARLRECHYGSLTRGPAAAIEAARTRAIATPFPDGESYEDVSARVSACLADIARAYAEPVLVVGHRATFYALEHLLRRVPLADTIAAAWKWQPGWRYELPPDVSAKT